MTTRQKLQALINSKRDDAKSLRNSANERLDEAQRELSFSAGRKHGTGEMMTAFIAAQIATAQAKLQAAADYAAQASRQDEAADELVEVMRRDSGVDASVVTPATINGVDFVEFEARFLGLTGQGLFTFEMLNGNDEKFELFRSFDDQSPTSGGHFGLPYYTGGNICPHVHTVRLHVDNAKSLGIL